MTDTVVSTHDDVDGRHARRGRNRAVVIEAVMAFLSDGEAFPTLQGIAQRSGLSLRSVHRYFDDGDDAVAAAVDAFLVRNAEVLTLAPWPTDASTRERVDRWIEHTIRVQEVGSTAMLAAMARADGSSAVGAAVDAGRQHTLRQLRALFEPELAALPEDDREVVFAALHSVTLTESWDNLVRRHGLDVETVRQQWRRVFLDLLQPA